MAENKKSVLLYCDIIHTVKELSNEEAGLLFKHYLNYINDLNPGAPDKLTQIVFEPIKQNLKRDLKSWEQTKLDRSNSGKLGMEKRWHNKNNKPITNDNAVIKPITNITVNDTVTVNVTDTVKDIININEFFKSLENSQFLEDIARNNKFTIDQVKNKLIDFRNVAELEYQNYSKFVSHFKNWIKLNPPTNNEPKFVC